MKERKGISNVFIVSMIASIISSAVGLIVSFYFWFPVVLPSYGWIATVIGVFAVPFVLYLVVFLPLNHFFNKNR